MLYQSQIPNESSVCGYSGLYLFKLKFRPILFSFSSIGAKHRSFYSWICPVNLCISPVAVYTFSGVKLCSKVARKTWRRQASRKKKRSSNEWHSNASSSHSGPALTPGAVPAWVQMQRQLSCLEMSLWHTLRRRTMSKAMRKKPARKPISQTHQGEALSCFWASPTSCVEVCDNAVPCSRGKKQWQVEVCMKPQSLQHFFSMKLHWATKLWAGQ